MDELTKGLRNLTTDGDATTISSPDKLVIAIDFGTTYSGVAYCFANEKDPKIFAVVHWPDGNEQPKIPTLISYEKGNSSSFKWGASVKQQDKSVVGIKLLLDPSQSRPMYLPFGNMKREMKALPKPPVDIVADYISAIYKHAITEISNTVPKAYMAICRKEYVLSVPAVWSDAAKNATLQAAEMTDISPVTLIKEPEAAALYTLKNLGRSVKPNETFVVCDAGGGTVDLVSYEVQSVYPKLEVKELVPGDGGMAGSMGLNKRFLDAVRELVGDEQWIGLKNSKALAMAEKQFDLEIKPKFVGSLEVEYFVNFPKANLEDDDDNDLEHNCWTLTGSKLRDIFEPIIQDILRFIGQQVQSVRLKRGDKSPTGICLVGGFGSSQYLKDRVDQAYPEIQVLQPNDAWAAIVKGAALSMMPLQAIVTSTSSTRHYGVEAFSLHDPSIDKGQPVVPDKYDGSLRTRRMTWYIHIGDDLLRDQKIKFSFFRSIPADFAPSDLVFKSTLYDCSDRIAPLHRSQGQDVRQNCTVTADLSGVSTTNFLKRYDQEGDPYWRVWYDLVVTLDTAVMRFSTELDGKAMGTTNVKFS